MVLGPAGIEQAMLPEQPTVSVHVVSDGTVLGTIAAPDEVRLTQFAGEVALGT